jgi:hypothetical protein
MGSVRVGVEVATLKKMPSVMVVRFWAVEVLRVPQQCVKSSGVEVMR